MGMAEILGSVSGKCRGMARAEIERSERILIAVQVFERNEARQVEFGQAIAGAIEGFQGGQPANIQNGQGEIVAIQMRLEEQPDLFAYWTKHVPENLEQIEKSPR